jgi:phage-related protein
MQRRWRHYETAAGKRPVLEFISKVSDSDKAAILAAMKEVRRDGTRAARHLRGDLFEVRADGERVIYRILFAHEGARSQILLSLVAFNKKTQRTPPRQIELAERRLRDWRMRARTDAKSRQMTASHRPNSLLDISKKA